MDGKTYLLLEDYMKSCMKDSAHDREHIYRVLYTALEIADEEKDVDIDVLIAACLLHDIARQEQFDEPRNLRSGFPAVSGRAATAGMTGRRA